MTSSKEHINVLTNVATDIKKLEVCFVVLGFILYISPSTFELCFCQINLVMKKKEKILKMRSYCII